MRHQEARSKVSVSSLLHEVLENVVRNIFKGCAWCVMMVTAISTMTDLVRKTFVVSTVIVLCHMSSHFFLTRTFM